MTLRNGEVFAGFRITRQLGSGGMGEVYLAEHPRLPRSEALKILPTEVSADPDFRARFNREADLAATLYHPHIVGVHDRGEFNGHLWISMDHVDGTDAARLLGSRYPAGMPREEALDIIRAVADALEYAHEHGLLHRDVKPANILLTTPRKNRRRILLADFGIARSANDISGLTATNMAVGSVNYAAPEQLMGEEHVDARADQYSLAATAYHLLCGRPPFEYSNPAVVISHHLNSEPTALSAHRDDLADLDKAIATALSKDPADRYLSCQDFAEALAAGQTSSTAPQSTTTAVALSTPTKPKSAAEAQPPSRPADVELVPKRRIFGPMGIAAMIVAALAAIGGTVVFTVHNSATTHTTATPTSRSHSPLASALTAPPPSSTPAPAPPPTTTTADPALTGPAEGSDCAHAQNNVATTSSSGTPIRCTSGPGGYSWQPDTGAESPDPAIIGQIGWDNCIKQFPQSRCVASAASIAGSPNTTGPVFPTGTYSVPGAMAFGTYAAIPDGGSTCSFYIYDNTGNLYNSGSFSNPFDKPSVEVNPFANGGRFQTVGCTPWAMVKPLSPDW